MLVVGSSARVLKPSGRAILFHNPKGIAVGCLTIGLNAFLCTHFFFFSQPVKVGWETVAVFTS